MGEYTYSVIRNVTVDESGFVSVYPNPSIDYKIYVDLKKLPADAYHLSVYDVVGNLVAAYQSQRDQRIIKLDLFAS